MTTTPGSRHTVSYDVTYIGFWRPVSWPVWDDDLAPAASSEMQQEADAHRGHSDTLVVYADIRGPREIRCSPCAVSAEEESVRAGVAAAIARVLPPGVTFAGGRCPVTVDSTLFKTTVVYRCEREAGHAGEVHEGPALGGGPSRATWPVSAGDL